jgi:hypothetical protein
VNDEGNAPPEDDDDPNKIWCICRKVAGTRPMIECDQCKDWFHLQCVKLRSKDAKAMEKKGEKWFCPPCRERARAGGTTLEAKKEDAGVLLPEELEESTTTTTEDEEVVDEAYLAREAALGKKRRGGAGKSNAAKPAPTRGRKSERAKSEAKDEASASSHAVTARQATPGPAQPAASKTTRRCALNACSAKTKSSGHAYCSERCIGRAVENYLQSFTVGGKS